MLCLLQSLGEFYIKREFVNSLQMRTVFSSIARKIQMPAHLYRISIVRLGQRRLAKITLQGTCGVALQDCFRIEA